MLTNSRDIKRRLEAEGWVLVRIKGSHHQFKRAGNRLRVTPRIRRKICRSDW